MLPENSSVWIRSCKSASKSISGLLFCLDSSMVEHAAVNRGVAGSSPARGAFLTAKSLLDSRLRGQAVKTSPFHGGNTGSIPVGVI